MALRAIAGGGGGGGSGTVTTVSVASANGLAGTVANATTSPAITLSTTVTGVLKGDGTTVSAATAGTDYLAPPSGTSLLKGNSGGALSNATAGTDFQAPISLTTTGTSGAATFAANVLNIPNYAAGAGTGTVTSASVVSANGFSGTVATATTTPAITITTSISGMLKGSGGALTAATANTDFQSPISLTTVGSTGAATFASNVLNIPNYSVAGTVTNVATGTGLTGGPITGSVTVPLNATVGFDIGTVITVVSNNTALSIIPASGVTLQLANSSSAGTRSLASNGIATMLKVAVNTWYVSGTGVT
jgi:hypothetical protein